MSIELKPGMRLRSTVSEAEVVVVKAPGGSVDLRSGGHPMVPRDAFDGELNTPAEGLDGELASGKRYAAAAGATAVGVELMVTKAGIGALSVGDEVLERQDARKLPSSD